jgi:FK506-binding protein 14
MCPGEKRKLTIPSALGYGQRGAGNVIPGGKQLFDDFYKAKAFYIAKSL